MKTRGIGVIGGGVVGSGVVKILRERAPALTRAAGPFELIGVAVRDLGRPREGIAPELCTSVDALLADPRLDLLVEVAGGVDAPFQWVSRALEAGKTVVTANKALLAERAEAMFALAQAHPGKLFFEAAVAGGIPIIAALDRGLAANRVVAVQGILNGTCNDLLSRMERTGCTFEAALAAAQAAGFAEADPTLDISGGDTAHKLAVLATLALERPINSAQIFTEGIAGITAFDLAWAEQHGYRIKLLGIGRFSEGHVELRVHPTLIARTRLLSQVMDELNAVQVEGDLSGPQLYSGRGAGQLPTASAVVSDVLQALRGESLLRARPVPREPPRQVPMGEVVSRHYVHLEVIDQPGVVAAVARALADSKISIASMFQPDVAHGSQVPLVFTTHPAPDAPVQAALDAIEKQSFLAGAPVRIRFEQ